jgi:hypothetical protein
MLLLFNILAHYIYIYIYMCVCEYISIHYPHMTSLTVELCPTDNVFLSLDISTKEAVSATLYYLVT